MHPDHLEFIMPALHSTPMSDRHSYMERPRCPRCQSRMMMGKISPAQPDHGLRTFTCNRYDRISIRLMANDPMKTRDALRWLAGDLKRPN